jgi:phosphatidate cytidylyltransferase
MAVNAVMAPLEGDPKTGDMTTRVISAVVVAPVALAAAYFGSPFFEILVAFAALILAFEWNRLCKGRVAWLVAGLFYIGVPCWALLDLRAGSAHGRDTLLWLFAVVWAADTGAYAFGRLIGGAKLAPVISPNKTWAGLVGGIGMAGAAGGGAALILGSAGLFTLAGWSAIIGAVSQGGDLAESWVKRHFGVKNTGAILPGHGGLFDRVDGLLAAAVAVALIEASAKGSILTWT